MSTVGSATGAVLGALESTLRFRLARQGVLAGNVANADTPGYRRAELVFDDVLGDAASRVRATQPGHIGGAQGAAGDRSWRTEREAAAGGQHRNGVDFDREIIQLSRNAGAFTEAAAVHSRLTGLLRLAISGQSG